MLLTPTIDANGHHASLCASPVMREAPLQAPTPLAWAHHVVQDLPTLLNDHAHCERKAAAFALGLLQRYSENNIFSEALSKLAREEMRHFELVLQWMKDRGASYHPMRPSNYAASLRGHMAKSEPRRLLDHLMIAALIEARSCERFALLVPVLQSVDSDLARFYAKLAEAERRHYQFYFEMADHMCGDADIDAAHRHWAYLEIQILSAPDDLVRMHSGVPTAER